MKVYKDEDILGIILRENNNSDMIFMEVFENAIINKDKPILEGGFNYLRHIFLEKYPDIQNLLCCNVLKMYSETNEEALIILFSDGMDISPEEILDFANYMDCNPMSEEMTIDYLNGKICLEEELKLSSKKYLYKLDYLGMAFDIDETIKGKLVEHNGKYYIDSESIFLGEFFEEVPYEKYDVVCDLDRLRDNEIELG